MKKTTPIIKTSQTLDSYACGFCGVTKLKTTSYFLDMYGKLSHTLQIPGIPKEFTVLQDLVPIAENGGHVLFLPVTHHVSLANIKDQTGVGNTKDVILKGLAKYFPNNPFFVFEHGPGIIDGEEVACGGCHFDHAHGHIMVMPAGITLEAIQQRMEEVLIENGWENPRSHAVLTETIFTNIADIAGIRPYIHIGMVSPEGDTKACTYVQKKKFFGVPAQLMRAVVAEVVYGQKSSTYWHWRDLHLGLSTDDRMKQLKNNILAFRKITGY